MSDADEKDGRAWVERRATRASSGVVGRSLRRWAYSQDARRCDGEARLSAAAVLHAPVHRVVDSRGVHEVELHTGKLLAQRWCRVTQGGLPLGQYLGDRNTAVGKRDSHPVDGAVEPRRGPEASNPVGDLADEIPPLPTGLRH